MVSLRPYQQEAVNAVFREWDTGHKNTLLVMATGTGKTVVFSAITDRCRDRDENVLILAHRGELLDQAGDKLYKNFGIISGMEKANSSGFGFPVVTGSVQTLQSEKRLELWDPNYFQTIVIDECHHAVSDSYKRILNYFSGAKLLGVTATADRADQKNLGEIFDSLAYEYPISRGVKEGYLVPLKAQTIPLQIDIRNVSVNAGDFQASELGHALEPYLGQIAREMQKYCKGRKVMIFLPLVAMSKQFTEILNQHGFRAAEVNGQSPDRTQIIADYEAGKYNVLCNSLLLTEGFDCPAVDCVICLRPTKSRAMYSQIIGRGTRLSPQTGKKDLLILDFLWMTDRHQLCKPAHLICKDEEIAAKVSEKLDNSPAPIDLLELEESTKMDILEQRRESLRKELEQQRRKKARLVDPLQYEMSIMDQDLASYTPTFAWEFDVPTQKQVLALEKAGINPDGLTKGKACAILDRIASRNKAGLSTPKQIRLLERYGFAEVGRWTREEATNMIGRISAANWQIPQGVRPKCYLPASLQQVKKESEGNNTWSFWKSYPISTPAV